MASTKIRINVMAPAQLVDELKAVAPPGERSRFIGAAVAKRIRAIQYQAAIAAAAGAWSDEDHPELMTGEDLVAWHRAINDDFAWHAARMDRTMEPAAHVPAGQ